MADAVTPIPEGFHSITPHLVMQGAAKAIEYYKKAFGAEELSRMPTADGNGVMHATIRIGSSMLMLNDEFPEMGPKAPSTLGGSPVVIHLYVDDVDSVFKQAIDAGAQEIMAVQDTFWGDRYGMLLDPFGHSWSIASRKEILTGEEIAQRAAQAFGG